MQGRLSKIRAYRRTIRIEIARFCRFFRESRYFKLRLNRVRLCAPIDYRAVCVEEVRANRVEFPQSSNLYRTKRVGRFLGQRRVLKLRSISTNVSGGTSQTCFGILLDRKKLDSKVREPRVYGANNKRCDVRIERRAED